MNEEQLVAFNMVIEVPGYPDRRTLRTHFEVSAPSHAVPPFGEPQTRVPPDHDVPIRLAPDGWRGRTIKLEGDDRAWCYDWDPPFYPRCIGYTRGVVTVDGVVVGVEGAEAEAIVIKAQERKLTTWAELYPSHAAHLEWLARKHDAL